MTPLEWKILNAKEALADVPVQLALDEENGAYVALDAVMKALSVMIFEMERVAATESVIPLPPPTGLPAAPPAQAASVNKKKQALAERRKDFSKA